MIRELLATDVERIESVCAVGAVFEEVFFALGKFFAAFVFAEAVAAAAHAGCLNGERVCGRTRSAKGPVSKPSKTDSCET